MLRRLRRRPSLPELLHSPATHLVLGLGVAWLCARHDAFSMAVVGLLYLAAALAAFRWPVPSLLVCVVALPYLQVVQAWLWSHEVVSVQAAVRLGYVKEVVLVVAFTRAWAVRPRPLESLDRFALLLVTVVGLYLLAPIGTPLQIRYVAARGDVAWIIVFLTARWLGAGARLRERAEPLILAAATLVAALAIWNRWGPVGWSGWVDGVGILDFRRDVLDAPTLGAVERVTFGERLVIRAGSVFFTANDMAYYLLVALGALGGRMVARGIRPLEVCIGGTCALAIFYSFSRSAMAMIGLVGLVVAVTSGRLVRGAGAAMVCGIGFALLVGLLGAGDQIASGADANDERTSSHLDALSAGTERLFERPFGTGLGTSSSTAIRFRVADGLQTENFYLRMGVEIGLVGTVGSATFVVWVLRRLWRRAKQVRGPTVGAVAALSAVAAGGMVLETFTELSLSWTVWLLVGLALPAASEVTTPKPRSPYVLGTA